jgi:hypothetical protein
VAEKNIQKAHLFLLHKLIIVKIKNAGTNKITNHIKMSGKCK